MRPTSCRGAHLGWRSFVLEQFLALKKDLRYCPVCCWNLHDDPENSAIRRCLNHGRVFWIYQTTKGYIVEVNTSDG